MTIVLKRTSSTFLYNVGIMNCTFIVNRWFDSSEATVGRYSIEFYRGRAHITVHQQLLADLLERGNIESF